MSELTSQMLIIEHRPCARCPLAKQPGFLGRMLGMRAKTDATFNYCHNQGPERIVIGGSVEVDYRTGLAGMDRDKKLICPAELTPEIRAQSTAQESLIYDRFEEAVAEAERRLAYPHEMTVYEKQQVSARSHIPPMQMN